MITLDTISGVFQFNMEETCFQPYFSGTREINIFLFINCFTQIGQYFEL